MFLGWPTIFVKPLHVSDNTKQSIGGGVRDRAHLSYQVTLGKTNQQPFNKLKNFSLNEIHNDLKK